MYRLPLFPLNVVLFPGAPLPLHIFEGRYRRMVARCLEYDRRFGVIFHDADRMGPFLMEESRVGTIAEIQKFRPLEDGRSLIATTGVSRIRLVDGIESDEPYYEGLVEPYEDEARGYQGIYQRRRASIELFDSVVASMENQPAEVPTFDPALELSFQVAPTIQIDPFWQQELLELRSEVDRLDRLNLILQAALDEGGAIEPREDD